MTESPLPAGLEEAVKARKRHVHREQDEEEEEGDSNYDKQKQRQKSYGIRIRQHLLQHHQREKREQRRIAKLMHQSQAPLQKLQKMYWTLLLNLIAVCMAAVLVLKPQWVFPHLQKSQSSGGLEWPPHHLAVLLPPNISPGKDLPLFFQQYAIATPENQAAREAMQKFLAVRRKLEPFQIFVASWERESMLTKPLDEYCGRGFQRTYHHAVARRSFRHAEDLLLWCLLFTYQDDGFLAWNVTLKHAPIGTGNYSDDDRRKGLVAQEVGQHRIHPSLLWLPKKRERRQVPLQNNDNQQPAKTKSVSTFDMDSQLPARMLPWLIQTAPGLYATVEEYSIAVEEYLYRLILDERDRWMILDAVCQDQEEPQKAPLFRDRTILGRDCLLGKPCCTVYLPQTARSNRTKRMKEIFGDSYSSSED